jgi:hypothetical protein
LFCGNGAKGDKHGGIYCQAVIEERSDGLLNGADLGSWSEFGVVWFGCILDRGSVDWSVPTVRCVFDVAQDRMFEAVEGCINLAWHGHVDMFLFVIPGNGEPAIKGSCPVSGDGVEVREGLDEMFGIAVASLFYTKVVNNEGEGDWAHGVLP